MKIRLLNTGSGCLLNIVNEWILEEMMSGVWNTGLWTQLISLWKSVWVLYVCTLNKLELNPKILKINSLSWPSFQVLGNSISKSISCWNHNKQVFEYNFWSRRLRKDTCYNAQIRFSLNWLRVIKITRMALMWRLWSLLCTGVLKGYY